MKWFRNNIRHGSRLALFALAIQVLLSFGHFHGIAAQASPSSFDTAGLAVQQPAPKSDTDSDRQAGDVCAICAVMAMANAALFATPPLLPLPEAVEFDYRTTNAEFAHVSSVRIAFQPRAPPIS